MHSYDSTSHFVNNCLPVHPQGPPGKDGLPGHPGQRGETVSGQFCPWIDCVTPSDPEHHSLLATLYPLSLMPVK